MCQWVFTVAPARLRSDADIHSSSRGSRESSQGPAHSNRNTGVTDALAPGCTCRQRATSLAGRWPCSNSATDYCVPSAARPGWTRALTR